MSEEQTLTEIERNIQKLQSLFRTKEFEDVKQACLLLDTLMVSEDELIGYVKAMGLSLNLQEIKDFSSWEQGLFLGEEIVYRSYICLYFLGKLSQYMPIHVEKVTLCSDVDALPDGIYRIKEFTELDLSHRTCLPAHLG